MKYNLNKKINQLKPYETDNNYYPIRLDANESFIELPDFIMDKILKSITKTKLNRYPDSSASECCRLFAKYHNINKDMVTAGNGSDELIMLIISAFLMKNEKILTLSPDFSMYSFYAQISENPCIILDKNDDLNISVDYIIKKAKEENARLIIFSNPCNPTSLGIKKDDIIKLINSTDALVVLDEAYMDFWDQSLINQVENFDNLIILRTCSKAFGIASIRLGFAVANIKLTTAIKSIKSPYNVNSVTQAIASVILSHTEHLNNSITAIKNSRDNLKCELKKILPKEIKMYDSNTNFILLKAQTSKQIFESLKAQGFLIRLLGDYLRITCGSEKENKFLIDTLNQILNNNEEN